MYFKYNFMKQNQLAMQFPYTPPSFTMNTFYEYLCHSKGTIPSYCVQLHLYSPGGDLSVTQGSCTYHTEIVGKYLDSFIIL